MKTEFYINGKKVSKATAEAKVGKARLRQLVEEAKESFMEDPCIENGWIVSGGILTISFS